MADSDDRRRSVYEFVRLSAARRRLMAVDAEAMVMHKAVFDLGLPAFEARCLILGGAEDCDVAVESRLDRILEILLKSSADSRDRLRRAEFDRVVRYTKALSRHALDDSEARGKLKRLVGKLNLKPRRDGLLGTRRWFSRIREAPAVERALPT
jgi:hypothetical protein